MIMSHTWRCALCGWLNPFNGKKCMDCAKNKPRARKRPPPPSFRPWRCVVLALDTAACTGWSVWVLGKLANHGEFGIYSDEGLRQVIRVVEHAKVHAVAAGVPWVAMSERSWGGRMGTDATHAFGYWTFAMRNAQLPRARIGQVYPATWRARVLPKGMCSAKRDDVRACEMREAKAVAHRERSIGHYDAMGHDEAAGILIGKWCTQAGEVGELLPKNARVTV